MFRLPSHTGRMHESGMVELCAPIRMTYPSVDPRHMYTVDVALSTWGMVWFSVIIF